MEDGSGHGSGSAALSNKKGGANADAVLGMCVVATGAITPGLRAWPCGAPADQSDENADKHAEYEAAKELLKPVVPQDDVEVRGQSFNPLLVRFHLAAVYASIGFDHRMMYSF
jgi:hypothetical protein